MLSIGISYVMSILFSFSAVANNSERLINCSRNCNKAIFEDGVKSGRINQEDLELALIYFEDIMQKISKKISTVCTESELELGIDAICYAANNNKCSFYGPKSTDFPPFSKNRYGIQRTFRTH